MLNLPNAPATKNEQSLASWKVERQTGLTGTTITLANTIDTNLLLLFQNGALVDPDTYTVAGKTITVGSASSGGDVWVILYHYRLGAS